MPTADISYNDPYCSSNSTLQQVNQTGTGGGNFSSDISGIDLNSSNGEINPSLSNPGSYVITYTIAASGGCPDVMAIDTVDISALPSATVSYPNSPFCSDLTSVQNAEIIGSSGGTYSASSGLTIDSNTGEFTPSSNMPGSYTITYTIPAANGCPVVTANTIIDITQLPAASISYGQPFCISEVNAQNVSLTGNTGGSFYADVAGLEIDSITGDIIPGLSSAGSYTVTYMIDSMNGCAAVYSTTSVTINEMPTAAISYSGSPFCTNNSTSQSVNISGSTGEYFTSSTGLQIDSLTGAINPSLCSEGTYNVAYIIPASGGCAEVVVNTNVTIVKSIVPVTAFTYSSPVCINGTNPSPQLDAGFYTGGNFSATSGITVNTTNGEVVLSSSSPGTYVVTYSTLASGCTLAGTSTADITIEPSIIPVTDFSYSIPSCMDGSTPGPTLTNGFTTGGFYSVVPAGLVIDSVTGEISLESSLSGSYTITYETTEIGCRLAGSSSSVVVVSNEGCLNIATAFSPNKDGANDTWEIEHIEMYDEVTLQVFNRWGQLMFEYSGSGLGYTNPDAQWDGTFNGKELPVSSFVFIVDLHNDQKPIQGIVTIIR
jgi:gliding motility-associated-like protein